MAAAVDHEWKKGSAELLILSLLEDQPRPVARGDEEDGDDLGRHETLCINCAPN